MALGIGCMLLSAGAFAAVIYFSHAGRDETDGTDGTQQVKRRSEGKRHTEERGEQKAD